MVRVINSCYSHCYIPSELLKGDITPIIKDVKGNTADSSNYRPVMVSSCILKILELHMLDVLEEKASFNRRQFGFTQGLSTTDVCFLLKEIIRHYIKRGGKA